MKNLTKLFGIIALVLVIGLLVGCGGMSKEKLEKEVAAHIEETLSSNPQLYRDAALGIPWEKIEVESVSLIERGKNEYSGIVTLNCKRFGLGVIKNTESLTVLADGKSFQWRFE
jgi:hypothetical protein